MEHYLHLNASPTFWSSSTEIWFLVKLLFHQATSACGKHNSQHIHGRNQNSFSIICNNYWSVFFISLVPSVMCKKSIWVSGCSCDMLLSHLSFISMLLLSFTPDITPWISMALVYYNIIFITLPYDRKHFLSFSVYSIQTGDINHLFSHTLDLEVSNSKQYIKLEITSNYIIQWFLSEANDRLSNNLSSSIIYSVQAGGEEYNRGWDGWITSLTQWTWVWASSRRWWRTGKPGMLHAVHGVAKSWTWLSNWTTTENLKMYKHMCTHLHTHAQSQILIVLLAISFVPPSLQLLMTELLWRTCDFYKITLTIF